MSFFSRLGRHFRPAERTKTEVPAPNPSVDFRLKEERVFLLIQNFSPQAAHDVNISFSQDLLINGDRSLEGLSIFSKLRYLAPYKEIEIFLDPVERFFRQLEDAETVIEVGLDFWGSDRKQYKTRITHDLTIYQDLPTIINT